jgi:hypothetical protein
LDHNIVILPYPGRFVDDELRMFDHSMVGHFRVARDYSFGVITVITGFSLKTS